MNSDTQLQLLLARLRHHEYNETDIKAAWIAITELTAARATIARLEGEKAVLKRNDEANFEIFHQLRMKFVAAGLNEFGGLEGMIDEALAKLAAKEAELQALKLPGWQLVPKEPTDRMIQCALDCQDADPEDAPDSTAYYCYRAMLASAPTPSGE